MTVREGLMHGGLPYLAVGSGKPVIVLPGISADNADTTGGQRRMNVRAFLPLTNRFAVYLINREPGLKPGSTLDDLADQYADAITHEFSTPIDVVGISTGGSIAQLLAIHHPALVGRLVLVASACRLSPYGRRVQRDLARYSAAGRPRRAWAATGPALAATLTGGALATALMWLAGKRMDNADPGDLLITVAAEDVFDSTADLNRITAPTLVIAGARDRFYSAELFRQTAQAIPGARLILFPSKGHFGTVAHRAAIKDIGRFLSEEAR